MNIEIIINIVTCIFTIAALVFTMYLWLLEQLSGEETRFVEGKAGYIRALKGSKGKIDDFKKKFEKENDSALAEDKDIEEIRDIIDEVNGQLEIIVNYRFWNRNAHKKDFERIKKFYTDSKYLTSTITRYTEEDDDNTLIEIGRFDLQTIKEIIRQYIKGLDFIIIFLEDWK